MPMRYGGGVMVMGYGVISLIITNVETVLTIYCIAISSQILFPLSTLPAINHTLSFVFASTF